MDALHKIAAYLIQKETITGKEFMDIYRQVLKEREGGEDGAVNGSEAGSEMGAEMILTADSEERVITPAEKIEAVLAEKANSKWSPASEADDSVVDV